MRILALSHAAVVPAYREKFRQAVAARSDLDVLLVTPPKWYEGSAWVHAEAERGERHELRPLPVLGVGRQYVHLYHGLRRCLAGYQPDLIHLEEEPPSLVSRQVCLLCDRVAPRAKLLFFTWENQQPAWHGWRRHVYTRCERVTHAHADGAIAGTAKAAQVLRQRGFAKPVFVLPQVGIDTARFAPQDSQPRRDSLGLARPVIGFVGRLIPEKGVVDLLNAFALLAEGSLLIVGAGPQRAQLDQRATQLGVDGRVVFADAVPHEAMPDYLNCLDVLVLPSRTIATWAEQFGRVLLEAMACGVPVIGSDSGSIPEVIGEAGLTFPEGDVEALAVQLRQLLGEDGLRQRLTEAGRRRACEQFSDEVVASRLGDIYWEVGAGSAPNHGPGHL